MAVLAAATVLVLAQVYPDWDAHWVVWQVYDAGTGNGESGGNTLAYNPAGPYRGLMQIWDVNAIRLGYTPEEMYNPVKNIEAAHRLWLESGKSPWPSSRHYPGVAKMELGVDFSEHGGSLASGTVSRWIGRGVKFAVVQYSSTMPQHLQTLLPFPEIDEQAFTYLYFPRSPWNQTPETRVSNTINMVQGFPVHRIWLDVEVPGQPTDSASSTLAALSRCERLTWDAGYLPGIYTSKSMWLKMTGNSQSFKHLDLWDANHIDILNPPHTELGLVDYGGWLKPKIWQYHNTVVFEGHEVDLNLREGGDAPVVVPAPSSFVQLRAVLAVAKQITEFQESGIIETVLKADEKQAFDWLNRQVQAQ